MGVTWGEVTTVEIERRPAKKRKTGAEETGAKETGAKKTGEEETGELASDENLGIMMEVEEEYSSGDDNDEPESEEEDDEVDPKFFVESVYLEDAVSDDDDGEDEMDADEFGQRQHDDQEENVDKDSDEDEDDVTEDEEEEELDDMDVEEDEDEDRRWMEAWEDRTLLAEDEAIEEEEETDARENLGVAKPFSECLPNTKNKKLRRMLAANPDWGWNVAFALKVLRMNRERRKKRSAAAVVEVEGELVLEGEVEGAEGEGGRREVVRVKNLVADRTLSAVGMKGAAGLSTTDWNHVRFFLNPFSSFLFLFPHFFLPL